MRNRSKTVWCTVDRTDKFLLSYFIYIRGLVKNYACYRALKVASITGKNSFYSVCRTDYFKNKICITSMGQFSEQKYEKLS